MKNIFLALSILFVSSFSAVQAQEEQKNNKLLVFIDPTKTFSLGLLEFMQYWTVHPDIDATMVMKDLPKQEMDRYIEWVKSDLDDPEEDLRMKKWQTQEERVEKDGLKRKVSKFLEEYNKLELKNFPEEERRVLKFKPIMDQGNRLAEKFKVQEYPILVVADVKSKRVSRYVLPDQFHKAVKDLDYLIDVKVEDVVEGYKPE